MKEYLSVALTLGVVAWLMLDTFWEDSHKHKKSFCLKMAVNKRIS